jgi:predicted restriction endonuclease
VEIEDKVTEIKNDKKIPITEKQNLTLSRIGQGKFRNELINYWSGCSVSKLDKVNLLVASHIKPWRESNNFERLDVFNGLLLLPNYDKLFDKGYINFDDKGKIRISKFLNSNDLKVLNVNSEIKLVNIENKHKEYLEYHNENCFIK